MDWLTALKSFHLVVEHQSFSKAAHQRYASSSALSKQIAWLERQLGQKLLHRTARQLSMTESGMKLYARSQVWLDDFEQLKLEFHHETQAPSGLLRVSAPKTFGNVVLTKHLPQFIESYPDIRLDIQFDNRYVNLINDQIDVAIRTGDITEKSLCSEPIGHQAVGLFASQDYLNKSPDISCPADILQHRCLAHSEFMPSNLWRFKKNVVNITPALVTNNIELLVNAAINSKGLLYLSEYAVADAVNKKKLVSVLPSYWNSKVLHSLVYPRQKKMSKKILCFIDFVKNIQW